MRESKREEFQQTLLYMRDAERPLFGGPLSRGLTFQQAFGDDDVMMELRELELIREVKGKGFVLTAKGEGLANTLVPRKKVKRCPTCGRRLA